METKNIFKHISLAFLGGAFAVGGTYLFQGEKIVKHTIIEKPIAQLVNVDGGNAISAGLNFTNAASVSLNSVVHINTETTPKVSSEEEAFYEQFFGSRNGSRAQRSSGSGVILSKDGYIVTNNHVVKGADKLSVTLNNNQEYSATIVGTDPATDLAVIKIDGSNLDEIVLGNSDDVKVGEWVLAVGNPFNLTSTVTAGIVSAKARSINIMQGNRAKNIFPIESFIQTDAAVNPGNSGGALVNTNGELVGINTAIASRTGSYTGYSFAVPVNLMKKVTSDLIRHGMVQRAFIGVSIQEVNQDLANKLNITQTEGVYVNGLSDGGAARKAGIKEGDIIISIEGNEVKSVPALQEQVGKHKPGDKIEVGFYRNGSLKSTNVTLKNIEGTTKILKKAKEEGLAVKSELGALLKRPSTKELNFLGVTNGVKVVEIGPGKLKDIGLEKGFVITKIAKTKVNSAQAVNEMIKAKEGKPFTIEGYFSNGIKVVYEISM